MEPGFTMAQEGILWRGESEAPLRWGWFWKRLLPNTYFFWSFRENLAWRCRTCRMLLIDHSHSVPATKR